MKVVRCILSVVFMIVIVLLLVVKFDGSVIATNIELKSLRTKEIVDSQNIDNDVIVEKRELEEKKEELKNDNEVAEEKIAVDDNNITTNDNNTVIEEAPLPTQEVMNETSNILETQVGSLSAYGPDCVGCSGYLASGFNAMGGNIYYNDSTYGNVRVVAGDRTYPFGTIIQVQGTYLGDFYAIVLDRGGGVGFGKRFLFDLLCNSEGEASQVGSFHNVTFNVMRYGY